MAPKKNKGKAKAEPEPRPASSSEEEATLAEIMRRSRGDVGDPGAGPSTRRYPSRVRRPPPLVPYKRAPLPALDWTTVKPPRKTKPPPPAPPRRAPPRLQPRQHEMTTLGRYVMDHPLGVDREDDPEYDHFEFEGYRVNPREAQNDSYFAWHTPIVPRTQQPRPHHAGASSSSSASGSKGNGKKRPAAPPKKGNRNGDKGVGSGGYWTQSMQQLRRNQIGLRGRKGPPLPPDQYRAVWDDFLQNPGFSMIDPLALQGAEPPRRKASTSSSSSSASASAPNPKKQRKK